MKTCNKIIVIVDTSLFSLLLLSFFVHIPMIHFIICCALIIVIYIFVSITIKEEK